MIKPIVRAVVLAAALTGSLRAQTFETLYQFEGDNGRRPEASMTIGPDGNLYGVTSSGGTGAFINTPNNGGVAFRFGIMGEELGFRKLADFNNTVTGCLPVSRLLNIGDGFLYGTNFYGGTAGGGTVYRLHPVTGEVTVVKHVDDVPGSPYRPVYLASGEPNVLHVACEDNSGILRVPLDNSPATTAFLNPGTPRPQAIIRASNGFLYGSTLNGGDNNAGTLFRANPDGTNLVTLHHCESATGTQPRGAMVQGRDGHLYGAMTAGGTGFNVVGVVYRLTLDGEYTVLRNFTDFDEIQCDLLLASDGMLYGTGVFVGPGGNGNGGIWRMKTDGTGYKVLHVFASGTGTTYPTGRNPVGGLVQAADGNIYGTTQGGIAGGVGTIFRLKLNLPPPPVNRPPIAVADVGVSTGAPTTVAVLANDFDPDGDGLTVTIKQAPPFGTAVVQLDGTILYTPGGSYDGFDAFLYEISDLRGGKSVGSVTISETAPAELFQPGTYNGLVGLDEDLNGSNPLPRGQFSLAVKSTGSFTGTLIAGKKRIPLKGKFGENGTATAKVTMPDRKSADVFFTFVAGDPSTIFAVFYGNEIWTGGAGPVRTSGDTKNRAYTIQIDANAEIANGPRGHGYGTVTIKPTGAVSVTGKLNDGSPLAWSTTLVEFPGTSRAIPVYSEPLKNGYIAGLLGATNDAGKDFVGALLWHRAPADKSNKPYPLGFTGEVEATIGRFIPPTGSAPVMDITSSGVRIVVPTAGAITGGFSIEGKNITIQPDLRAFTINRANGTFSGTMKKDNKTYLFKGAVNQGQVSGRGQVILNGETHPASFIF